jgi:hypothetical protein
MPPEQQVKPLERAKMEAPLFTGEQRNEYSSRWDKIQIDFVNDPRKSVQAPDQLVAEVMQTLAKRFSDQRSGLEREWREGDVSTEDLRVAFEHYRSFFDRLLSI